MAGYPGGPPGGYPGYPADPVSFQKTFVFFLLFYMITLDFG